MKLHPETKLFLDMLTEQNAPSWSQITPSEGREVFAGLRPLFGESPEVQEITEHRVAERFLIRVFRPTRATRAAALLYFHGGGWVLGDLDTHDPLCRSLAAQSGVTVVSVDYRRAPEHKHPAALEDCCAALEFVCAEADRLNVDPSRLAVAGDSAGGNLALGAALRAHDTGAVNIKHLILIYPVVEPEFERPSYRAFAEGFGLTRESMIWFWKQYLGEQLELADQYVCPSRVPTLAGLPPTHIITAEFDVLRDEGELLADQLRRAEVPTVLRRYDGVIHGFIHFNGVFEVGRAAIADIACHLREGLQV